MFKNTSIEKKTLLCKRFMEEGWCTFPLEDIEFLDVLKISILREVHRKGIDCLGDSFDRLTFGGLNSSELNGLRMTIHYKYLGENVFKDNLYKAAKNALDVIVGNELVRQKRINLSVQVPHDNSSLLPLHSDVWSGDSPFEVVLWVPLVDVYGSKSMYILPRSHYADFLNVVSSSAGEGPEALYNRMKDKLTFLEVKYGEAVIFDQTLPHGNIVNETDEIRWSLNSRYKSIFSPYRDKNLIEFFEICRLHPATLVGLNYRDPFRGH